MNKISEIKALWGKKQSENGEELWLPLLVHLIDTERTINWLYHHWLTNSQRQILLSMTDESSEEDVEKLVKFLGFFHDIGKATPVFQSKKAYNYSPDLDNELMEKLLRAGFYKLDEFVASDSKKCHHSIAGEAILEKYGLNQSVGSIIGSHHGKPCNHGHDPRSRLQNYTSYFYQFDKESSDIRQNWIDVQEQLIKYGLNLVGYKSLRDVPNIKQTQAVILTGLLIMADWLASSEVYQGTSLFPLVPLDITFDDIDLDQRFEHAIENWDINNHWYPEIFQTADTIYHKNWKFSPRPVQLSISEAIGKTVDPGMIIIEAPMGLGKTEIALTAVEQISSITGSSGLFMGLPTQATSNAMFDRVENWLSQISKSENIKLPITLMHGKAQFNTHFAQIPVAKNVEEDSEEGSVIINSWFSGKKNILNDFVIGTIDHLLLMGLKQKHLFLRHLGLSGKVIVIDEVHAYDTYMSSYLTKVLKWLGAYHVPVIALSATLPKEKRKELIKAYVEGKFGRKFKINESNWEDNESYPLLTMLDENHVEQYSNFLDANHERKRIKVIRLDSDDEIIIEKVLQSLSDGGVAGIIVNTVKRAQHLYDLIPDKIDKLVLHSAFIIPERLNLEKEIQSKIGKNSNRPKKMIVIGTQVLEQSLDIDFDILFTDIAPMDLILQRIGRLHRHQISRPPKLVKPKVYILGANKFGEYGDSNEAIYNKYFLLKTDYFFPNELILPDNISKLVQKVYETETDSLIPNIQESFTEYHQIKINEQKKAKVFQIKEPSNRSSLIGWLNRDLDINSDLQAEASVRDIKETVEVILLKQKNKEFFLINGVNIDEATDIEIAQQIIRLPYAVVPEFKIESTINELEKNTNKYFSNWKDSVWLRGDLALILDENMRVFLNGWIIKYRNDIGLTYEKMEKDDKKV